MNQITLSLRDKTDLFYFLENIAEAQQTLAEKAESDGSNINTMYSIKALATIQKQAMKQLGDEEQGRIRNIQDAS
jgi:hypothetical protein